MIVLGLTGSMAMGKTTVAKMFESLGVPVFDADRTVHDLLNRGSDAITAVAVAFPSVVRAGTVDRKLLADRVFASPQALLRLEGILHPLVAREQRRFVQIAARQRRKMVVLDIPLLFETDGDRDCDAVAVVTAPSFIQRQRLRTRSGIDDQRLAATLSRQMPDGQKRRLADFVIPTGIGRGATMHAVKNVVMQCMSADACKREGKRRGRFLIGGN
jgi:dephospho-CoA kinase